MQRATVLRVAALVVLLFTLLPVSGLAQQPGAPVPVYVRGYVKGDCGDKGVTDAVVEIYRVQTGALKGRSVVKSEMGDWGISLSGTYADYRIVVTLPEDAGGQVFEWTVSFGDLEQQVAGAVNQVVWQLGPATPLEYNFQAEQFTYGPITIYADVPCTQPQASGPAYVWGRVMGPAVASAVGLRPAMSGPLANATCMLYRETVAGRVLLGIKSTNAAGFFGFGITPVKARYWLVIFAPWHGPSTSQLTVAGPDVEKSYDITPSTGAGPMYLGTFYLGGLLVD